jgi:hypothetical protein
MKTLRKFKHINAKTTDEAVSALRQYGDKACVIAGGTDLIGTMRFEVLHEYPEALINLKTIPGLDYIKEENGTLKIGALTRLEDIAGNSITQSKYPLLAEAAHKTALRTSGLWAPSAAISASLSGVGTSGKRITGSTVHARAAGYARQWSGTTVTTLSSVPPG